MDGERENYASRRALLTGAPALGVIAAVAAETGIALANAADPWVSLGAAYFRHRDAADASASDDAADHEMDAWGAAQNGLMATRPTTVAGVIAGLKAASADLYLFQIENREAVCPGIHFIKAMMDNACAALERGVANV